MNKSTLVIAVFMLGIGLGAGYWLSGRSVATTAATDEKEPIFYRNPMNPSVTSPVPAKDSMGMDYIPVYAEEDNKPSEREILFYRNPMNPSVTSPVPAKDSMGMDYVPVYADEESNEVVGTVKIDPVIVQNIGVRTAIAQQTAISRTIRAVGRVDFNEERMARLHPKVEGWIEEIRVDKTGQNVADDDILLSIYSPKLVSAQQEYLLALNNLTALEKSPFDEIKQGARDLVKSSRERLQLLDVPEHQVQELEQSREIKKSLHIHSPVAGTVIRIGSRHGQYVTPKTELYMMVDLSQVWVYADVYEYELPWVKVGDEVEMTLASVPGKTFTGSLDYIYPYAEPTTRTTKVRLVFDNSELLLRPDMFAEVSIQSDAQNNAVVIPAESVIRSGGRTQVFVVRAPGKFEPRLVELGIESNGQVAVLSGVDAGEEVVTSAQFLVDSESKLREATAKMMEVLNSSDTSSEDGAKTMQSPKEMEHSKEDMIEHSQMQMNGHADMDMSEKTDDLTHGVHDHD
ncbi:MULTISPECIES: efflux RND transporter periplasmic adaptor subunit [unclassified Spongiibacter]|uniref:efflux RND transporter periplasmic adaptor subunit n=1 Tax=Spongiibacter TaxID=630749 RepID=UPI000C0B86E4|nr:MULTISPECIES: efflux RND transporter periplasmic adaptor subunit [unclassified Spongiibacter]MAK42648.1 efflux transporter periplasmic adaptor subunit [Spongiibacter sp.]|tara:strand:+ start:2100 stop:3641 length:1542 start_codon:yes stop_codon:yes gene_type:complete